MSNQKEKQLQIAAALLVGFVFAIGLAISGMTQPQKVLGFLTIGEGWDPSLMFVMMAAIPVHFISYRFIKGRKSPLFDTKWHLPTNKEITKPLVIGSVLFGFGWGIGGFCPGPALTSAGAFQKEALVFVVMMTFGMILYRIFQKLTVKG